MNLLIVDADEWSAHVVAFAAKRRGHGALVFSSVSDVPNRLPFEAAVIVLGVSGPANEALPSLRFLRQRHSDFPVIVACEQSTSSASPVFEAGANQVAFKPFYPDELIVRAEVLAKSSARHEVVSDAIKVGDLEVDLTRYTSRKAGSHVPLTKLELRLLYSLMRHHGSVSPIETLLTFGWNSSDPPNESLLKTHISHLRTKLSAAGGLPVTIRSRHALGYVLTIEQPARADESSAALLSSTTAFA